MPVRAKKKPGRRAAPPTRNPDVLDVHKAAELLTVSADTVYDLFKSGGASGAQGRAQVDYHAGGAVALD